MIHLKFFPSLLITSSLFLSSSTSLFSLIFWFMVKFFHLHQKVLGFMIFPKTKSLIFFRCSPFILFFEFSQIFFYIPSSHIFICAYLSYYIHADYFLLIYLFPCIFININIGCGHSVNKKKTLWLCTPPQIHSQWFTWLSTSNLAILHWMLDNSQTPPYSATYTFSPTTVSLQHLFSTDHFFGKYSMLIPLIKNIETARRMAAELSTDTTKTSTSSDSSSATSKVNVKPITRLLPQITLNIAHSLFSFFGLDFCWWVFVLLPTRSAFGFLYM